MKVAVTGGSGKLGQLVLKDLLANGHETMSLDRVPSLSRLGHSWIVDMMRSGDLFQAFKNADAVVHLAAYPAPNLVPDDETFSNNVTATYNVLNAALQQGVRRVVMASSIAAFGLIYALKESNPEYLPLDEKHPCRPQDPYGLSKVMGEQIADSFAAKSGMTICSLRFPGLAFDYNSFPGRWKDPAEGRRRLWTYIDARDAATACRLALEVGLEGHEIFTLSAPGSHHNGPTSELLEKYYPLVRKVSADLTGNWSCEDSGKAMKLLGYKPMHRWEDEIRS